MSGVRRALTNGRMDLCIFGCSDSFDWIRYIKDMFTSELKEHPQWHQFDFHVRGYPIDPANFPFQTRSARRCRRSKTKLLLYSKQLHDMITENSHNLTHISEMLERGHLVVMTNDFSEETAKRMLKKVSRFNEIEFVPDLNATMLFEKTIKLLVKPLLQVQEFLCFPQTMPDIRPLGEICLLAEDLLDPFNDYLLEFHQEGTDVPLTLHADMLTAQSLTIPLPQDLKPGPVHIKIYPYRFRQGPLLGEAHVEILPILDYVAKTDIVEYLNKYLSIAEDAKSIEEQNQVVDEYLAKMMLYLIGSRDSVPGTVNPFYFLAERNFTKSFEAMQFLPQASNLDDVYDYHTGQQIDQVCSEEFKALKSRDIVRLKFPPDGATYSDFEVQCEMDPVSDDSGCASEVSSIRSPSPELVKSIKDVEPETEKEPVKEKPAVVEPAMKILPKKVIAPTVVPNMGPKKPGRNALIEERMKATGGGRRTSFVKPVTKSVTKSEDELPTGQTIFEAPKWDDIEEEQPKAQTGWVVEPKTPKKDDVPKPSEDKKDETLINTAQKTISVSNKTKAATPTIQQPKTTPEPQTKETEFKPEIDISQSFNEKPAQKPSKPFFAPKFVLPELSQDIVDAAKEAAKPVSIFNPEIDLKAAAAEDDKWIAKQNAKKEAKRKKPEKKTFIKLANGKVKKGSGMRFDKRLGFERYWSSSEEETESSESEGEPELGALPGALMGISNVTLDYGYYDSSSGSDSDSDTEPYKNKPMSSEEANKVEKLYDGDAQYIRARREFEREMAEINNRKKNRKEAPTPVYNNAANLKREQQICKW